MKPQRYDGDQTQPVQVHTNGSTKWSFIFGFITAGVTLGAFILILGQTIFASKTEVENIRTMQGTVLEQLREAKQDRNELRLDIKQLQHDHAILEAMLEITLKQKRTQK